MTILCDASQRTRASLQLASTADEFHTMASRFSVGLLLVLTTVLESSSAQTTAAPGTLGGACAASGSPSCANSDNICHNNTCVPFVGLGGTCSRFDTCHGKASLACVDSTCLIQVGQPCADNRDKCVTGAQCNSSSSQCHCQVGYLDYDKDQERKCRRQADIGADCSDGADCVSYDNGVELKCDFYKFTCVIKNGDRCDTNTEMFCPSGAECQNNTCTCITPYKSDKGACSKVISTLGGMCDSEDICQNATLGLDMDCDRFSGRCLLEVDQSCQGYPDMCSTGAVCSSTSNTCVCSGVYTLSDSARSCQGRQGTVGGKCNSGNMCSDTASAKCDDGYCLCKTGYFVATNSSCVAGESGDDGTDDNRNTAEISLVSTILLLAACLLTSLPH
ncbi:multiple epidermal growth factor-like domains protein 10 [Littorina saxatilis]|uniref:multiple epidermal growth factor-like domains protein 10 n=1 Tax=Littorina saxatilis TaxID=31220 RepID=UPI0038B45A5C